VSVNQFYITDKIHLQSMHSIRALLWAIPYLADSHFVNCVIVVVILSPVL